MRKIALLSAALFALACGACCSAEKNAVSNIERTHEMILPKYVAYVDGDPALSAEQKDDQKKLVDSLKRLTEALRNSLEE